ncbi:hypothetical protein GCM10010215_15140 [Streptomyces virginiae]|uniref:Uncharacterized protein n=1 Tax=Streptomyces virginiae TaxID=1961 RepID=A0ABQ3NZW4_STRVG|nr:hypothetical protein GCM10010215_15140 [Streptomyces virginiae]GHI18315.1 hypothetical protein Scinn_77780 [Streptomyces virginiae]GLV90843.1 hypothetical protein Slala04_22970 [Streptomyces lavendulae subsp. lavendulae]
MEAAQPLGGWHAQHRDGLSDGEGTGQGPQEQTRRAEPAVTAYDPGMSVRCAVLCRVSHASPASRRVDRNPDFAWLPRSITRTTISPEGSLGWLP